MSAGLHGGECRERSLDQQPLRVEVAVDGVTLFEGWPGPEVLLASRRVNGKPYIIAFVAGFVKVPVAGRERRSFSSR